MDSKGETYLTTTQDVMFWLALAALVLFIAAWLGGFWEEQGPSLFDWLFRGPNLKTLIQ